MFDFLGAGFDLTSTLCFVFLSPWGWFFCLIASTINVFLYGSQGIYADMTLQGLYILMSLQGLWQWRKNSPNPLKISHSPYYSAVLLCITLIAVYPLQAFLALKGSNVPILDAFTTLFSLAALWLSSQKIIASWGVWFVLDLIYTYLYASKGLPAHALVYGLYIGIAVMGARQWLKIKAEHEGHITSNFALLGTE